MIKQVKIFKRDFTSLYDTIGLVEAAIFGRYNRFNSLQEAENYIVDNPDKFRDNEEYIVLTVFTKE